MSTLRASLDTKSDWLKRLRIRPVEMILLPRVNAKLAGDGGTREAEPTEKLQLRILAALEAGGVQSLPSRDLKNICRVFLHPPHAPGRDAVTAAELIAEVSRQKRRSALFGLMDSYLDGFQDGDLVVSALGSRLGQLCIDWPWRKDDIWQRLHHDIKLFDGQEGPRQIAEAVMQSQLPVMRVLDNANLGSGLRPKGGLAEAAFRQACRTIAQLAGPAAMASQVRLMEWANLGDEGFIYPRAWWNYADALFRPWRTVQPSDTHQNRLMDVAVKYAGDPRTNRGSKWAAVEEQAPAAYEVILRWLTKASFEQFFTIVDQMTDRPDMWRQRKRFWSAYLNKNYISSAWVIFGDEGRSLANRAARQSGNEALMKFGTHDTRTPQHTALLMQIGDAVVVDWSHNGKWNIWGYDMQPYPRLFQLRYTDSELRSALNGPHDAYGRWEQKVIGHIFNETGLRP